MSRLRDLALATFLAPVLMACGDRVSAPAFRGVALTAPIARPSLTLTDFNGRPWDFAAETRDKVALLFFGYTHCPDVCPLHMANIAAVLRQMPAEDKARVVTVFVTTDPERDTPARLREWLANFDASFVGLTGTKEELARAQQSLNLAEATREYLNADSVNYFVAHAAQVFAFARDGFAYTIYPFGIRQEDWANDLPRLIRDATGADIRRDLAAQAKTRQLNWAGGLRRLPWTDRRSGGEPASQDEAAAYLTLMNDTPQADTIVAIAADLAVRGEIHETMGEGEMRHMMPTPSLVIPARTETKLAPGGTHVMLMQLRKKLVPATRDAVPVTGSRALSRCAVIPYADLEKALGLTAGIRK
jgi:protein SCO1/2